CLGHECPLAGWGAVRAFSGQLQELHAAQGRVDPCSSPACDRTAAAPAGGRPTLSGAGLTGGAEVRRAVHERRAHDRRATARAGPSLLPVGPQGALEVAALAVDVDVERVEGRAALP